MSPFGKGPRRSRTCLSSLRTGLNMAAALGVVPYSMRGRNVVFGLWQMPYNILATFMLPYLGCYILIFPNPKLARSFFSMFIFEIQLLPYCTTAFLFLFHNMLYRDHITSAFSQLLRIERMLFLLNMEPEVRISILKEAAMPLVVVCFSVAHMIIHQVEDFSTVAMFLYFQYATFRFFAVEGLVIFFLGVIRYYQSLLLYRVTSREAVLVQLCRIQDTLADVTASIEKVYGLPFLLMVISNFLFINVNMFLLTKIGFNILTGLTVTWTALAFIMIFWISLACDRMKEKAEEFYEVLYRIVKKDKTYKLLNNDYLRVHLTKKKTFSFNLAGFAVVDMSLVAVVISSTATYTVILIEMGTNF